MSVTITRHVEFDSGHRVPDHASKCRHLHGHRYRLDVTVSGEVRHEPGHTEDGMVCDFGVLADVLAKLADEFDHRFLVAANDLPVHEFLVEQGFALFVVPDGPPTAEVLVGLMAEMVQAALPPFVYLTEATLWETPKCRATYSR